MSEKPDEIIIEEMHFSKDRGLQLSISHPLLHDFALEFAKFFKENGGINFVSTTMYNEELGMFDLIIQRHDGKTAQMLYFEAQQTIKGLDRRTREYQEECARLNEIVRMVRNFPDHVGDYDACLPDRQCNGKNQHLFRDGWSHAVEAINKRITELQKEVK